MAKTFTGLKLQGQLGKFGKTEISDIEGYVELPDGKVLSGSEWGNLLLWDGGLIKVSGKFHRKVKNSVKSKVQYFIEKWKINCIIKWKIQVNITVAKVWLIYLLLLISPHFHKQIANLIVKSQRACSSDTSFFWDWPYYASVVQIDN